MDKSIMITYPTGSTIQLKVLYVIELIEDLHTINCAVDGKTFPIWLQLRKFSMSSQLEKCGNYTPLYTEANDSRNMDTSLFIDLVYSGIMKREHCNVLQFS